VKKRTKLVGEFILVVVGVLVALAVESALEDRADDKLRDQYLSRLTLDLAADKSLLLASFYAAEVWPLTPNTSTYLDLHSTGNLRLLDDIGLRTKMAVYYNKAVSTESGMNPNEHYREWIRGVIPTGVQDLIRER